MHRDTGPTLYSRLALVGHRTRHLVLLDHGDPLALFEAYCRTACPALGLDGDGLVQSTREAIADGVDGAQCVCAAIEHVVDEAERRIAIGKL